jgi:hypothetical protein
MIRKVVASIHFSPTVKDEEEAAAGRARPCVSYLRDMTVLSKREHPSFGGKGLTDEKSPLNFLKTIFTPTHQFYPNQTIFPSISVDLA